MKINFKQTNQPTNQPLCLSAHAQTRANIQAWRTHVVLIESAPSGQGMQVQEATDKMFFLLSLHARQHFSLPVGLLEKEMLCVGIVTIYYKDFWNSS